MIKLDDAQNALKQARMHWQAKEWQLTIQACAKALAVNRQLAEAHKLMGDALQKIGKAKEAIGYYEQAIVIQPDFAKVYVNLGSLYANQKQWEKAIHYYRQALTIAPQLLAVHEHLAQILVLQQQQQQQQQKSVAIQPSSSTLQDYLERGKSLKEQGKIVEALQEFDRAREIAPHRIDVYQEIVNLNERLGRWQEAAKYCRVILQLSAPDRVSRQNVIALPSIDSQSVATLPPKIRNSPEEEYLNLAQQAIATKQYKLAINYYHRAVKQQPGCVAAYLGWANLLIRLGKREQAIACYLQALKEVQDNPQIYFHLGNVYKLESKLSQAAVCYQKAIQYNPEYGQAHHELAEILSQKEQWSSAIASYRQAILYNSHFSWSYNNLGYALLQLGQWREAIPVYQKAIELNPSFPWAYYNLGETYSMLEQWSQAVDIYEQAKALDPDLPKIEQKLGNALYRRSHEDLDEALKHFLQAIEQDPQDLLAYHQAIAIDKTNLELYLRLGESLLEQGQLDEAIVTYQMALQFHPQNSQVRTSLQEVLEKKTQLEV